jgi:hypothetical protein
MDARLYTVRATFTGMVYWLCTGCITNNASQIRIGADIASCKVCGREWQIKVRMFQSKTGLHLPPEDIILPDPPMEPYTFAAQGNGTLRYTCRACGYVSQRVIGRTSFRVRCQNSTGLENQCCVKAIFGFYFSKPTEPEKPIESMPLADWGGQWRSRMNVHRIEEG